MVFVQNIPVSPLECPPLRFVMILYFSQDMKYSSDFTELKKSDFPRAHNFWREEDYDTALREYHNFSNHDEPATSRFVHGRDGPVNSPPIFRGPIFIVGPNGLPLDPDVIQEIFAKAHEAMLTLHKLRMLPSEGWSELNSCQVQWLCYKLETEFEELRYCQAQWKAERILMELMPDFLRHVSEQETSDLEATMGLDDEVVQAIKQHAKEFVDQEKLNKKPTISRKRSCPHSPTKRSRGAGQSPTTKRRKPNL